MATTNRYEVLVQAEGRMIVEANSAASALDRARAKMLENHPTLFADDSFGISLIPELIAVKVNVREK